MAKQARQNDAMERPGGEVTREVRPPVDPPAPDSPPGHSIASDPPDWMHSTPPPPVWYNVTWYRLRAEELGDLALDMIEEGLEGMAYGASRKAAHYGRLACELYRMRAAEMIAQNSEWEMARETPDFLKGLVLALGLSIPFWAALACGLTR
jgi:hypothetical protein